MSFFRLRVFENRMLRRIFGEAEGWTKSHNEELHNCYSTSNAMWRIRWARHVTRMGKIRNTYKILVGKPKAIRPLGKLYIYGRIMLSGFKKKCGVRICAGFIWLRIGFSGGFCEPGK
jgi:hypothetical protein